MLVHVNDFDTLSKILVHVNDSDTLSKISPFQLYVSK